LEDEECFHQFPAANYTIAVINEVLFGRGIWSFNSGGGCGNSYISINNNNVPFTFSNKYKCHVNTTTNHPIQFHFFNTSQEILLQRVSLGFRLTAFPIQLSVVFPIVTIRIEIEPIDHCTPFPFIWIDLEGLEWVRVSQEIVCTTPVSAVYQLETTINSFQRINSTHKGFNIQGLGPSLFNLPSGFEIPVMENEEEAQKSQVSHIMMQLVLIPMLSTIVVDVVLKTLLMFNGIVRRQL
jgi:hypothetical protein